MDPTEGRLSLAVLAAGATLALVAGTAWWVSAAPEAAPAPVETTPPAVVVPEQVVPGPVQNGSESYLPEFDNTVERQIRRIGPDERYTLEVPVIRDRQYWLQYVCVGPGDLSIRVKGGSTGETLYELDCEGNLRGFHFTAAASSLLVDVHRPGPEPAEVGVQVIRQE